MTTQGVNFQPAERGQFSTGVDKDKRIEAAATAIITARWGDRGERLCAAKRLVVTKGFELVVFWSWIWSGRAVSGYPEYPSNTPSTPQMPSRSRCGRMARPLLTP